MTKQEGKFGVDALVHLVTVYLGPVQMDKGRYVLSVSVNIYTCTVNYTISSNLGFLQIRSKQCTELVYNNTSSK
jgi:hypothetical protein